MASEQNLPVRRALLILSLTVNLGLLGFFKYGGFLLTGFTSMMESVGIIYQAPELDIILPVGISFYTFQTLSYTIEIYRGKMKPWPSFLDFALFVAFFPQLVAGPIVRAGHFLPQCREPIKPTGRQMGWGLTLITIGLCQKVVFADGLMALVSNQIFGKWEQTGFLASWLGTLAFSAQIYFDFCGYSLCAIGVALCMGFILPDNFRFPYGAIGFSDFWRRWHISLSTWLRDFLYISLGGNRKGKFRTYVNLMITMLLGGLWHGASWRFVVWGGLHGLYLVVERFFWKLGIGRQFSQSLYAKIFLGLLTYVLVCFTWVFFRAESFEAAFHMLSTMVYLKTPAITMELRSIDILVVGAITVGLLVEHALMRNSSLEQVAASCPWWLKSLLIALMLIAIMNSPGERNAFIYFQF